MDNNELTTKVGEWLAAGYTDEDIINELRLQELSEEDAKALLKNVYTQWQSLSSELDFKDEDQRNWHIFMRKRLLQSALEKGDVPSMRLALSILDSLAQVQGLGGFHEATAVPLHITLNEKKEPLEQ